LKRGWWKVIKSLIRILPDGKAIKKEVDAVIDICGAFQNLREVIYEQYVLAVNALERKKAAFALKGKNFLIRYFYLIIINAYFRLEGPNRFRVSFVDFLRSRLEVPRILDSIVFPEN